MAVTKRQFAKKPLKGGLESCATGIWHFATDNSICYNELQVITIAYYFDA